MPIESSTSASARSASGGGGGVVAEDAFVGLGDGAAAGVGGDESGVQRVEECGEFGAGAVGSAAGPDEGAVCGGEEGRGLVEECRVGQGRG